MQQASCGTQRAGAVQVRPVTASDRAQSKLHASHAASSAADEPQVLVPQHRRQTAAADVGGAVGADVGGDEAVGDEDGDIDGDVVGSEVAWDSAGAEVDGGGGAEPLAAGVQVTRRRKLAWLLVLKAMPPVGTRSRIHIVWPAVAEIGGVRWLPQGSVPQFSSRNNWLPIWRLDVAMDSQLSTTKVPSYGASNRA